MSSTSTFSESWHRVAGLRVELRPTIDIHRQTFRGEKWFVIRNSFSNEFFRVPPAAYDFLMRLRRGTVEQAWQEALDASPDDAPTQDEVIGLLAQLYRSNLIRTDLPVDTGRLFERYQKRRHLELRQRLTSLASIRIPLFDPDRFLAAALPVVGWLFGKFGALLWLGIVGAAIAVAIGRAPALADQWESVLAPANLPLLYLALFGIKLIHELGHAFACKRFGGEVHGIGLMLLYFSPVPFVDATSAWAFRSRWHRALVGAAGMIVELFVAALAVFVWAATAPGVVHSLAYNVIFIASVTTILFNANPLLRFDGYYILSDLLEIPNLQQRANAQLRTLAERHLFGCRRVESPAQTPREAWLLGSFGIASAVYRVVLMAGIALFIADKYLLLGLLLAAMCLLGITVFPAWKLAKYLATSPSLARTRRRAVLVTVGGLAVLLGFLALVPWPRSFRAPGVMRSAAFSEVFAGADGTVKRVAVTSGTRVTRGTALLELENPELDFDLAAAEAGRVQAQAELDRAVGGDPAGLATIRERLEAFAKHAAFLREQKAALIVRAPQDGIWAAPLLDEARGAWVARGTQLGKVVDDRAFVFSAVISQQDAASLFNQGIRTAAVRVAGQGAHPLTVVGQQILPAEQEQLPSAALGWQGGGDVATARTDTTGLRAAESFFELRASVRATPDCVLRHGQSGRIRFTLSPEPLLRQWERQLRQLLQRRFQT